ncbi:MAG: hypothetical protein ACLQVD_18245 [Capsulimonadaceae bacterium]
MIRPLRRLRRWWRRTVWFMLQIGRDIGLPASSSRLPLWLADNAFLTRQRRRSVRGSWLYIYFGLLLGLLAAVMVGGFALARHAVPSGQPIQYPPAILIFTLVFILHLGAVYYRANLSTHHVLGDEVESQTLDGLLGIPCTRGEMALALTLSVAARRAMPHLTALPLYALLVVFGGGSWSAVLLLYLIIWLACLTVPPLMRPPMQPSLRWMQTRAIPWPFPANTMAGAPFMLTYIGLIGLARIPGIPVMAMAIHFFNQLGLNSPYALIMALPALPEALTDFAFSPLPLFHLWVAPVVWILAIGFVTRASNVLYLAGILPPDGPLPRERGAPARRGSTLASWVGIAAFTVAIGIAWRAWMYSGDLARLVLPARTTTAEGVAGLLLLIAMPLPAAMFARVLSMGAHGKPGPRRPLYRVLHRVMRLSLRAAVPFAALFFIACLLGEVSPWAAPVGQIAARIGLACVVSLTAAVGLKRAATALFPTASNAAGTEAAGGSGDLAAAIVGGLTAALLLLPLACLLIPPASLLAAISPLWIWIQTAPCATVPLSLFSGQYGIAVPTYAESAAGPIVFGIAAYVLGTVIDRLRGHLRNPAQSTGAPKPLRRWSGAAPAWIARRTDNPVFLRGIVEGGLANPFMLATVVVVVAVAFLLACLWMGPNMVPALVVVTGVATDLAATYHPFAQSCMAAADVITALQIVAFILAGIAGAERALLRDRQQGSLGALLLTPLSDKGIFLARIAGRAAGSFYLAGVVFAVSLILASIAAPQLGALPCLREWAWRESIAVAILLASIGSGAGFATLVLRFRWLVGVSAALALLGTLCVVLANLIVQAVADTRTQSLISPAMLGDRICAECLVVGIVLGVSGIVFGHAWFCRMRRRDIEYGDGPAS